MKRLTREQVDFYHENGYLTGLPIVYDTDGINDLNAGLNRLLALLEPGETTEAIREWHEASRFLYDIAMQPTILDCVEDVLSPNFYLWASNFFIKEPHSSTTVTWHQDAFYWPLTPQHSLTVWLAFEDVDEENAAMQVIPGSHKSRMVKHVQAGGSGSVLSLECEKGSFREDTAVSLCLKAGQFSIHNDNVIHGSPANHSDRRRPGLTLRYSDVEVTCDLTVNPHFKMYMCRGEDTYRHNPYGEIPLQQFGRLKREHRNVENKGNAS